ncbi:Spy/CpxP family protein refolding chaperone [Flavobacterium sp.]|uniref:Spy/CpxP family protein refolding chaperone n=1 Tax=Flavobacterium sp. TaxID=239 RepID=UPI003526EAA9
MKTNVALMLLLVATAFSFGQNTNERKDKIKALKIAYITEKLNLTTEEAQKFWPIYNAFDEKQFELRHAMRKDKMQRIDDEGLNNLSEQEAQELLTQFEKNEDELHTIRKKFINEVKKVLSAKKIILLKKTEDEFNRKLLHEFKGRKGKK